MHFVIPLIFIAPQCANLCAAFQLNISAAGYLDGLHAHLLAAVPNADWLEVWACPVFQPQVSGL